MSEILQQLGLNSTLVVQAGLFVITVTFLRYFVFSSYVAANEERVLRTSGSETATEELATKLTQLEIQYEVKAKDLNENVSQIFTKQKTLAAVEGDRLIQEARSQYLTSSEQIKRSVQEELNKAKTQLPTEAKGIAAMMVQKLLAKGAE